MGRLNDQSGELVRIEEDLSVSINRLEKRLKGELGDKIEEKASGTVDMA